MGNERLGACAATCAAAITVSVQAAGLPEPFTSEGQARGLDYQIANITGGAPGYGCAFVDLDQDGDLDIAVVGRADGAVGIFENDGAGCFTSHTETSGIPTLSNPTAITAGDFDGDGDLDLLISDYSGPDVLARNDGGFTFTNVAAAAGVDYAGTSEAGSWADFDGDGDLDIYLCVYNQGFPQDPLVTNRLYENLGDGTFAEIAALHGVDDPGYSFQSVWFDYDDDGDVDLYVSNDRGHFFAPNNHPNQLWRNDDGVLVNVSAGSGADLGLFSMGVGCGDFNGDGRPDLYCTNVGAYKDGFNPLFINQGDGTFVEISAAAGVDQYITSWGAIFFDFDNDGPLELYVNNDFQPNALWALDPGFPCVDVAPAAALTGVPWTTGVIGRSFSSAVGDVDGDGDLDLLETNIGHNVQLYINHEGETRNWIRLRIIGEAKNRHAIGASADVLVEGTCHWREVLAGGNGYLGQNELTLHVGAGAATVAEEARVRWPAGGPRVLTNLPVNVRWDVYPTSRLGDADGDGAQTHEDYLVLEACYGQAISPGCEMMDFDGNSVIDAIDAAAFFDVYDGALTDCNDNGLRDLFDVLADPGSDVNDNRIPDTCEVPGDANGDGQVDVDDLVLVIQAWGPCPPEPPCPGDVTFDDEVDVDDLVAVIQGWTP